VQRAARHAVGRASTSTSKVRAGSAGCGARPRRPRRAPGRRRRPRPALRRQAGRRQGRHRWQRRRPAGASCTRSKRQLRCTGWPGRLLQRGDDAALGTDPVQLEAVGHRSVRREPSGAAWADSGLIQVLNCCSGNSLRQHVQAAWPQGLVESEITKKCSIVSRCRCPDCGQSASVRADCREMATCPQGRMSIPGLRAPRRCQARKRALAALEIFAIIGGFPTGGFGSAGGACAACRAVCAGAPGGLPRPAKAGARRTQHPDSSRGDP
jgi:hypothetical protein